MIASSWIEQGVRLFVCHQSNDDKLLSDVDLDQTGQLRRLRVQWRDSQESQLSST